MRDTCAGCRKLLLAGFAVVVFGLGLACTGGGGGAGGGTTLERLEGELYLQARDRKVYDAAQQTVVLQEYVAVDTGLDNTVVPTPYGTTVWYDGTQFQDMLSADEGFLLISDEGDGETGIKRLSVAIHKRAVNVAQETLDILDANPDLAIVVVALMNSFVAQTEFSLSGPDTDIVITAGGRCQRIMKEGAQESIDQLYALLVTEMAETLNLSEAVVRLMFPEDQLMQYSSQLLYSNVYVGGNEMSLSQFLDLFRDPANWSSLDFKLDVRISGLQLPAIENLVSSGSQPYQTGVRPRGDG